MFSFIIKTILFFYIFLNLTHAICPINYNKIDGNCISNEKGFSSLKIIYCSFKNKFSKKPFIISVIKNPYKDFTKISYPKFNEGKSSPYINLLPIYPETDEETCKNQIENFKFESVFKTQIIDLFTTQKRYLCDVDHIKYEYFYLESESSCQYITYDYFRAPISNVFTFKCPENDGEDETNRLTFTPNTLCPGNVYYNQSIEMGSKISFPDTCNQICVHGNCVNSKCECYPNWSGDTCNIKSCENDVDCLEISKFNVCSNSTCQCKPGFIEVKGICIDENECETKKPCNLDNSICIDTIESYKCECKEGFMKYSNSSDCLNISKSSNNSYICINEKGGSCQCKVGYSFKNSLCIDNDECLSKTTQCPSNSICQNLMGSYRCQCHDDYILFNSTECIPFPTIIEVKPNILFKGLLAFKIESVIDYSNIFIGITAGTSYRCHNYTYKFLETFSSISCVLDNGIDYNALNLSFDLFDETKREIKSKLSIPFIKSLEKASTAGSTIRLFVNYFNNFTMSDQVNVSINNQIVKIINIKMNVISIKVGRGSGGNLPLSLNLNNQLSTDTQLFIFQEPFIENYTTVDVGTGGFITIYGNNFGNDEKLIKVLLKDTNDKQPIGCSNLKIIENDKILKCKLPPVENNTIGGNVDVQKLIWVKVDGLLSKDLIYFYYNQDDKSYNCDPITTCSNHGICSSGHCVCNIGWSGPDCNVPVLSDETSPPLISDFNTYDPLQKIKTENGTTFLFGIKGLIEYTTDGEIIESIDLAIQADWVVSETIYDPELGLIKNYTTTLLNYAEVILIFVEPINSDKENLKNSQFNSNYLPLENNSIRLFIKINLWPFKSRTNYLDVVMESTNSIKDKNRPPCRTTSFTKYSQSPWIFEKGNNTNSYNTNTEIIWYLTTNNYVSLFVQFINKIKIDNNIRTIKIFKKQIIEGDNNNTNSNTVNVILRIPYFNQSISFNPTDFKIINNDKPFINEQLTCTIPITETSNKLIVSAIFVLVSLLALFSGISITWFIIKKKRLLKLNNQKSPLPNPETTTTTSIETITPFST